MALITEIEALKSLLAVKKVLVFDFDGVLADSVNVKTEAFAKIYQRYGQGVVDQVVNYHVLHGGVSRYDKFKFYEQEVLGHAINGGELEALSTKFSELVVDKVVAAKEIVSSTDFLNKSHQAGFKCVVNSATPENEIKMIVEKRGIGKYLDGVFGSPSSKSNNLKAVMSEGEFTEADILFFGDAEADMNAADELQVEFVGVGSTIKSLLEVKREAYFHIQDFKHLVD